MNKLISLFYSAVIFLGGSLSPVIKDSSMCFVISAVAWKILLSLWSILAQLQTLDFSLGFYIFAIWTLLLLSLILLLIVSL